MQPELGVRLDAAGLGQNLSTLDIFALQTAEKCTDVVASLGLSRESCGTSRHQCMTVLRVVSDTDNLRFHHQVDTTTLDRDR